MIKPQDIRIGNYVQATFEDKPIERINRIEGHVVGFERKPNEWGEGAGINSIIPIPLTEEWLIKLGFTKYRKDIYDYGSYFVKPNDNGIRDTNDNKFYFFLDKEGGICFTGVDYVHELQNLIFALTGNELTIS